MTFLNDLIALAAPLTEAAKTEIASWRGGASVEPPEDIRNPFTPDTPPQERAVVIASLERLELDLRIDWQRSAVAHTRICKMLGCARTQDALLAKEEDQ